MYKIITGVVINCTVILKLIILAKFLKKIIADKIVLTLPSKCN